MNTERRKARRNKIIAKRNKTCCLNGPCVIHQNDGVCLTSQEFRGVSA